MTSQVLADVFGAPVYVEQQPDAASFGAALRAAHGLRCATAGEFVPFMDVCRGAFDRRLAAKPDAAAGVVYTGLLHSLRAAEMLAADFRGQLKLDDWSARS